MLFRGRLLDAVRLLIFPSNGPSLRAAYLFVQPRKVVDVSFPELMHVQNSTALRICEDVLGERLSFS